MPQGSQGGSATHTGLGGGGGKGGISPTSPIGQWLQSQGLAPTLGKGANDTAIATDWSKLGPMQQLAMINQPQGGSSLYDALIGGGMNQGNLGQWYSNANYNSGFGNNPNAKISPYGGGFTPGTPGYASGGLFGPSGTPGGNTAPPPVTPPPALNRSTGPTPGQRPPPGVPPPNSTVNTQPVGGAMPMQLPPQLMQFIQQLLSKGAAR